MHEVAEVFVFYLEVHISRDRKKLKDMDEFVGNIAWLLFSFLEEKRTAIFPRRFNPCSCVWKRIRRNLYFLYHHRVIQMGNVNLLHSWSEVTIKNLNGRCIFLESFCSTLGLFPSCSKFYLVVHMRLK